MKGQAIEYWLYLHKELQEKESLAKVRNRDRDCSAMAARAKAFKKEVRWEQVFNRR